MKQYLPQKHYFSEKSDNFKAYKEQNINLQYDIFRSYDFMICHDVNAPQSFMTFYLI